MRLIHGDKQSDSRQALDAHKKKHAGELVVLDGAKLDLTSLKQALESVSLFGNDRLVVIEALLSSPKSARQKELSEYLVETNPENLILWEPKKIQTVFIKKIPAANIQEFKPSTYIFELMEALTPGNTTRILHLYIQSLKADPPELINFMVLRQLRLLIKAKSDPSLLTGPSWLTNRIVNQSKRFNLDDLLNLHSRLYDIDLNIKTGKSSLPLETSLELVLGDI
jgi:DNA polymerase III delta subunit